MFTVRKHIELDAGHRVPYHKSHCRNLHGHRYRVTAEVQTSELVAPDTRQSDAGMVLDFGVIKQVLMDEIHKPCDHKLLLWDKDPLITQSAEFWSAILKAGIGSGVVFLPCIPTAEELARYWGQKIEALAVRVWDERLKLVGVEVRETPTSIATWRP